MDDIAVIPMTNEALQAVDAPFVTFEQPFPERDSRLERQMDAFREGVSCVFLTDTWPDAQHHAFNWGLKVIALNGIGNPIEARSTVAWPETAIYKTNVAKLYEIDERVLYRRHMHFFCQLRDNITGHWLAECGLSSEAGIKVPDRGVYDLGLKHPVVAFAEQTKRVTGILVVDHLTAIHPEAIASWQIQTEEHKELIIVHCDCETPELQPAFSVADLVINAGSVAPSDAFNLALQQAHGEYVTLLDPQAVSLRERLTVQCDLGFDISISAQKDSIPMLHTHSWRAGMPTANEYAIVFHRRVFERTGGMYPTLPLGYVYDKYLHAQQDHELSFGAVHYQLIGNINYPRPYGKSYSQNVYNDVFRRRMIHDRESHAWYIRRWR